MSVKDTISQAGRKHHTVILRAREADGSVETREAEPYSYRFRGGREFVYCYDVGKRGIRQFAIENILSVEETGNTFQPRWPVEV